MESFKYVKTLVVTFEKPGNSSDLVHKTGYFYSTSQTIINQNRIDFVIQFIILANYIYRIITFIDI